MVSSLISLVKYIKYKKRYPDASIHRTANVCSDSMVSKQVSISCSTSVIRSTLGQGTSVHDHCSLSQVITEQYVALHGSGSFNDLTIGSYSYIASNATVSMTKIGRFCSIGPYLMSGYGDHPVDWLSTCPVFFSTFRQCGITFSEKNFFKERNPIEIGNDVWIGARVFIRDGVKVGNGAIIAAGAVVVKDVPDYAIVGGVPAKVIRYRFTAENIEALSSISWWNWSEEKLRSAQPYFAQNDVFSFLRWAKKNGP